VVSEGGNCFITYAVISGTRHGVHVRGVWFEDEPLTNIVWLPAGIEWDAIDRSGLVWIRRERDET